jgi:hypothetical protein
MGAPREGRSEGQVLWLGLPVESMAKTPLQVIGAILARAEDSASLPDDLRQGLLEHVQSSVSTLKDAAYLDLLTGLPNRPRWARQSAPK